VTALSWSNDRKPKLLSYQLIVLNVRVVKHGYVCYVQLVKNCLLILCNDHILQEVVSYAVKNFITLQPTVLCVVMSL